MSYNAVKLAKHPVADRLMREYPWVLIKTSGEDVGLPAGVMGNSEVGHQNIGAGRIVDQETMRITRRIRDGSFFENQDAGGCVCACEEVQVERAYFGVVLGWAGAFGSGACVCAFRDGGKTGVWKLKTQNSKRKTWGRERWRRSVDSCDYGWAGYGADGGDAVYSGAGGEDAGDWGGADCDDGRAVLCDGSGQSVGARARRLMSC